MTSEPGLTLFYNGKGSSLFIGRGRPGYQICESFGLREWSRDRSELAEAWVLARLLYLFVSRKFGFLVISYHALRHRGKLSFILEGT